MRLFLVFIFGGLLFSCNSENSSESNEVNEEMDPKADLMLNDTTCDCTSLDVDEKRNVIHLAGIDEAYTGWCVLYLRGGILKSKRQYENGMLNGDFITYHPNGNIESIIPHKNNRYDGWYLKFSASGDTIYKKLYKNGVPMHADSIQ